MKNDHMVWRDTSNIGPNKLNALINSAVNEARKTLVSQLLNYGLSMYELELRLTQEVIKPKVDPLHGAPLESRGSGFFWISIDLRISNEQ